MSNLLLTIVLTVQILCALGMIGLILLQHGKGADMGASFGSGSAGSLFGSAGSANFLSRSTAVLATLFFAATLALAFIGNSGRPQQASGGVIEAMAGKPQQPASAAKGAAEQIPAQGAAPQAAGSQPQAAASAASAQGKAGEIPK
jgi:preprotein translocase subunit SecG